MAIVAWAKKVVAVVSEYERALDFDPTAYLMDRVHLLEQEVIELKRLPTNTAVYSEKMSEAGPLPTH